MNENEDLGNLHRTAIAGVSDSGLLNSGQAAAARRRHHRRRAGAAVASAVVAATGLLILVTWPDDGRGLIAAPPSATPSTGVSLTMTADSSTAAPDSVVTLWFPGEIIRGVAFTLESRQNSSWTLEYHLVSSWRGEVPGPKSWSPVGAPNFGGWPDIAIGGPGGERVRIPATAEPGIYRLCTANAPGSACTLLTIS